ncbi:ANTAR domain-containing protein [Streptomyces rubiginosohelvolus]|uniref:ANTAR domain-containing protein n=1 Tax=Streptomyces rubiginosohelvolus TaxID=67362 RepID=UPI00382DF441
MPSRTPLTLLPSSHRATVIRVTGTLDAEACAELEQQLQPHFHQADRQHQRVVLDMSDVHLISAAARRTLHQLTAHLEAEPALVVGGHASVRTVLLQTNLVGVQVHATLAEALAALPPAPAPPAPQPFGPAGAPPPADEGESDALRTEVFGLRAKARTSAVVGTAQGILMARYGLPSAKAAFAQLRQSSQQFNVPLRVLASAVTAAPPPHNDTTWFPGRPAHTPPLSPEFLTLHHTNPADRRQVLTALVYETVVRTEADAVEVHLTDPAQDDALFLEKHHRLTPAYADSAALVFDGPDICARARHHAAPVTVPDVITDTELTGHRAGRLLTDAGTRSLHSTPLLTADGHCTGTLTLHWSKPGPGPSATQQKTLAELASQAAAWRSWYRRTIVLDALEHLHTQASSTLRQTAEAKSV